MAAPRLSVLMPVYNELATIEQAIGEVLAADLPADAELVIVDDGSSDGTRTKLKSLNAGDARVKGLVLSRNFGKESAMAAGLRVLGWLLAITVIAAITRAVGGTKS